MNSPRPSIEPTERGFLAALEGKTGGQLADAEAAAACAVGPWKAAQPVSMDAAAALDAIAERDGMVVVHPTREDEGFAVAAAELLTRLVG